MKILNLLIEIGEDTNSSTEFIEIPILKGDSEQIKKLLNYSEDEYLNKKFNLKPK